MKVTCPECEKEYDDVPWGPCPHCGGDVNANYQRPPIEEEFPAAQEPNTFLLEIIINEDDKVVGFGGSPRATVWLHGILERQKAYLSELADYGRTVKRLNDTVHAYEQYVKECPGDCIVHRGGRRMEKLRKRIEETKRR